MSVIECSRDAFEALHLRCDCGAALRVGGDTSTRGQADSVRDFVLDHLACELPVIVGSPSRSRIVRELSRRPPAIVPTVIETMAEALDALELSMSQWPAQVAAMKAARDWLAEARRRRIRSRGSR